MLDVGKIIYLLDKKTQTIVPCMIVEKVKSVTLEGENTHHMIVTPSEQKLKLENYKHPWFETTDDARNFLTEVALDLINKTIEKASHAAIKAFQESSNIVDIKKEDQDTSLELPIPDAEAIIIDLGDGQVGKVTLPSEVM